MKIMINFKDKNKVILEGSFVEMKSYVIKIDSFNKKNPSIFMLKYGDEVTIVEDIKDERNISSKF